MGNEGSNPSNGGGVHRLISSSSIIKLALIVTKALFVKITMKVEGLDTHVGSVDAALQEVPKVLKPIRVNLPVNVGYSMIG